MYLDTTYISTKFQPDWTSNIYGCQATILENQLRAITLEPMAGLAPNFTSSEDTLLNACFFI
jgi:hypothetical protein